MNQSTKRSWLIAVACLWMTSFVFSACMPLPSGPQQQTPLETRSAQSRDFKGISENRAMKAVLNVLLDEGFVVSNAVESLGIITASKETSLGWSQQLFGVLLHNRDEGWPKSELIEANANISDRGGQVRVRISFRKKILNNFGGTVEVEELTDVQIYQSFLAKVDKGIFLERERL